MSRAMLERYSHIRMKAKREAVEALTLPEIPILVPKESHKVSPKPPLKAVQVLPVSDLFSSGGRDRTRTCDLLRVKQAL